MKNDLNKSKDYLGGLNDGIYHCCKIMNKTLEVITDKEENKAKYFVARAAEKMMELSKEAQQNYKNAKQREEN